MSVVNTNIRAFNSKAESLKFHNLYFMGHPNYWSHSEKLLLHNQTHKIRRKFRKVPSLKDLRQCSLHQSQSKVPETTWAPRAVLHNNRWEMAWSRKPVQTVGLKQLISRIPLLLPDASILQRAAAAKSVQSCSTCVTPWAAAQAHSITRLLPGQEHGWLPCLTSDTLKVKDESECLSVSKMFYKDYLITVHRICWAVLEWDAIAYSQEARGNQASTYYLAWATHALKLLASVLIVACLGGAVWLSSSLALNGTHWCSQSQWDRSLHTSPDHWTHVHNTQGPQLQTPQG